jgi:hypothetical protein
MYDVPDFGRTLIWEDSAACKILLQGMQMICLQVRDFSKMTQIEKCKQFPSATGFGPTG